VIFNDFDCARASCKMKCDVCIQLAAFSQPISLDLPDTFEQVTLHHCVRYVTLRTIFSGTMVDFWVTDYVLLG
jgi:hypothetical protein